MFEQKRLGTLVQVSGKVMDVTGQFMNTLDPYTIPVHVPTLQEGS